MDVRTTKDLWQDSSVVVIQNVTADPEPPRLSELPVAELAVEPVKPEVEEANPIAWIDVESV
jgi:hypothetical protein